MLAKLAERFTLERQPGFSGPVLAIKCQDASEVERYLVENPQQLFLEIVNVLGPWLAQPGTLPEARAGAGVELFDQFREVMTDLLDTEKEEAR